MPGAFSLTEVWVRPFSGEALELAWLVSRVNGLMFEPAPRPPAVPWLTCLALLALPDDYCFAVMKMEELLACVCVSAPLLDEDGCCFYDLEEPPILWSMHCAMLLFLGSPSLVFFYSVWCAAWPIED